MPPPFLLPLSISPGVPPSPPPPRSQRPHPPPRNLPVLRFPFLHSHHRQTGGRVFLPLVSNVNHHGRPEEMRLRNLIERDFPRRKIRRRIHMRPVVLEHPKAPREITILLHRRIRLGLKYMIVPGPRRKFLAHRIRHIHHEIPPVAHSFNPVPFRSRLVLLRHSRRDPESRHHRKHNHQHPTQFHNPHRISPSKIPSTLATVGAALSAARVTFSKP